MNTPCRRDVLAGGLAAAVASLWPYRGYAMPDLQFRRLADGVFMHISWIATARGFAPSNGLVVLGGDQAVIFDTAIGRAQTEILLARISGYPDRRLAITHAHGDRMSGIAATRARGIWSMAHQRTASMPYALGQGGIDATWQGDSLLLDVGGRKVEWFYPGPAHSPDNTVAYVRDCNVLYGACMVRAMDRTNLGGLGSADVQHWPRAIRAVRERYANARVVVPGHGDFGDARLLDHTLALAEATPYPIKSAIPN